MKRWAALLVLAAACSPSEDDVRVWNGHQALEDAEGPMPDPLLTGVALFICAQTWGEERPDESEAAFDALSGIRIQFVSEAELLADHPEFEHAFEDSPLPGLLRVALDAPADPLMSIGHGCGHLILENVFGLGFTDDTHSTEGVWDGGVIALVQSRIAVLLAPSAQEALPASVR